MKHSMYIVKNTQGWYQLRYTKTHEVLGCGPVLQPLLDTARRYVLKYRREQYFDKAVHNLSYRYVPKEEEKRTREQEYINRDMYIDDMLLSTITEALQDARKNTPLQRIKSRLHHTTKQ